MRTVCLIGHLVNEDQRTPGFQCSRNFLQYPGIDLGRQQVSYMEVEGYIAGCCKAGGEIIAHDVRAEKAHIVRHAGLQGGAFASLDAWLDIQDGGL